jgi:hypothetical protein
VPRKVGRYLQGHDVTTVPVQGWASIKNGKLLELIETLALTPSFSNDKRLEFDQNISRRPFAVLLLSTNHFETIKPNVGNIASPLQTAEPGKVTHVHVGRFVPRRFRNQRSP